MKPIVDDRPQDDATHASDNLHPFTPTYNPATHWRPGCGLCKRYRTLEAASRHSPSRYARDATRPGEFWQIFRCEKCHGWHHVKVVRYEH